MTTFTKPDVNTEFSYVRRFGFTSIKGGSEDFVMKFDKQKFRQKIIWFLLCSIVSIIMFYLGVPHSVYEMVLR